MTEQEWLECDDLHALIVSHRDQVGERRYRLYECACCRQILDLTSSEPIRRAMEICEAYADGRTDAHQLNSAHEQTVRVVEQLQQLGESHIEFDAVSAVERALALGEKCAFGDIDPIPASVITARCALIYHRLNKRRMEGSPANEQAMVDEGVRVFSTLFHDIFGNPFRPVTLDPRWLSSTVLDLARTIYDERLWGRMPILADALMDAGCDSEEILNHCRGPGPHVRGCWVVDLLLGKE
jgi:hypothetical protein